MFKNQIKNLNLNEIKNFIEESAIHYIFRTKHAEMPDELFKIFLNSVTLQTLDDNSFLKDKRIRNLVDWNKINRKQLIRLMTRDLTILEQVNFEDQKFNIIELEMFLKLHPEYINRIDFDFDNITVKECMVLLNIDVNAAKYMKIGLIPFNRLELQCLIKKFVLDDYIMNSLDFNNMDNYIKRFVLRKTGVKYLNKINLNEFNELDWVDLIQKSPMFFKYCNQDILVNNDCLNLIKIAHCVPEAYDLIVNNADKISGLGWEKLLKLDFKKYSEICNWSSLNNLNFKILKKLYPEIEQFRN